MFLISLLAVSFSCLSCCLIFHQFIAYPSSKANKVILNAGNQKSFSVSTEASLIMPIAKKIEPILKLEEYKKDFLQQTLTTAGINSSAESYTANALAYAALMFVIPLPFAVLLSPILLLACAFLAVFSYKARIGAAQKIVLQKRMKIEVELPRFSSTIHEQLGTTRDVVKIFESYRKVCPKEFEEEITKTLADMKTGNHETALRNFENRMGSYKLSEVVRGLIGVLNGNNQIIHFEILTNDLIKAENEEMRREAQKRPGKLMSDEILLFLCMVFMFSAAIGQYAMQNVQAIF